MSLATASMTENAPTARAWPPSAAPLKPLSLNMPWQQGLPTADKLALTSSLGALQLPQQLAPAAPALAQWGQPWGQQCAKLGEQFLEFLPQFVLVFFTVYLLHELKVPDKRRNAKRK